MVGSTNSIETPYKSIMHAKREIPVSNCPSEIDNLFYASGVISEKHAQEEKWLFDHMLEQLDERAERLENKKTVRHKKSLFSKKLKKNIHDGVWCRVDTDGKFWFGNNHYLIDDQEVQYQPVQTDYGDYYAMDKILYANGKFYDMNYDEVKVQPIGGIVPYDMVGTET